MRDLQKKITQMGDAETFWEYLGLSMSKIAKALREGMDATKTIPMTRRVDRDTQEIVEMGPYVDHPTRIEAAMSAAKLRGEIRRQPERDDAPADTKPLTFIFNIGPTQVVTGK